MKNVFHLGKLKIDAAAYGSQGNAILGIRDSGKTYTATEIAEKLFEAGVPFITFDPTGVWRWLRNPGKGRGYPIVVVGGKFGDLPLVAAHAAEIVRAAMKNGVSMVIDLTDDKLSKADWRRIVKSCVTVLLQENAQHGLRHIFIEEAAEFCPQKVIDGDVYAVIERLARIGGNSRLGYTLVNQRSQEVNKAVLELCENLFLHRQKGKYAIQSLDHWMDVAGVDQKEIVKSLPSLPSGHCWAWMGGNDVPQLIQVPPKNSFHPDRRVMHGAKAKGAKKAVNVGNFVKDMKAALVSLQEEFEANDAGELKKKVALLTAELTKLKTAAPAAVEKTKADPEAIKKAEERGFEQAKKKLTRAAERETKRHAIDLIDSLRTKLRERLEPFDAFLANELILAKSAVTELSKDLTFQSTVIAPTPTQKSQPWPAMATTNKLRGSAIPATPRSAAADAAGLTNPQLKLLQAINWWASMGFNEPSRRQVAAIAGWKPTGSNLGDRLSELKTRGLVDYPSTGMVTLTPEGSSVAPPPETGSTVIGGIQSVLTGPQNVLFNALLELPRRHVARDELANQVGWQPGGSNIGDRLSEMKGMGIIAYPTKGFVALEPWVDSGQ